MSVVPHTRTHFVNRTLRENARDVEGILYGPLNEIREPVQIFDNSNRDPTFSAPVYEFQNLINWFDSGHRTDPLTRREIGYDDIDAVEWIERPNDNYVGNTNARLAALRPVVPQIQPHFNAARSRAIGAAYVARRQAEDDALLVSITESRGIDQESAQRMKRRRRAEEGDSPNAVQIMPTRLAQLTTHEIDLQQRTEDDLYERRYHALAKPLAAFERWDAKIEARGMEPVSPNAVGRMAAINHLRRTRAEALEGRNQEVATPPNAIEILSAKIDALRARQANFNVRDF